MEIPLVNIAKSPVAYLLLKSDRFGMEILFYYKK